MELFEKVVYRQELKELTVSEGYIGGVYTLSYSFNPSMKGGSFSPETLQLLLSALDRAKKFLYPIVVVIDGAGANLSGGIGSLGAFASIFKIHIELSGIVPQIGVLKRVAAGGHAYLGALMDFLLVKEKSSIFITGPKVVKAALGEELSIAELGGHSMSNGVANLLAKDDDELIATVRSMISVLPASWLAERKIFECRKDKIEFQLPEKNKSYEMRSLIEKIDPSFLEIYRGYGDSIITVFAVYWGRLIGVVANNPAALSGAIDCDASIKAAAFIRFCDAFSIPILTLVDVPGFMPGLDEERKGIVKDGSKMLTAYGSCRSLKLTIILRKSYGGAHIVMASRALSSDFVISLPNSSIAIMGSEQAMMLNYQHVDETTDRLLNSGIDAIADLTDAFKMVGEKLVADTRRRKFPLTPLIEL